MNKNLQNNNRINKLHLTVVTVLLLYILTVVLVIFRGGDYKPSKINGHNASVWLNDIGGVQK